VSQITWTVFLYMKHMGILGEPFQPSYNSFDDRFVPSSVPSFCSPVPSLIESSCQHHALVHGVCESIGSGHGVDNSGGAANMNMSGS